MHVRYRVIHRAMPLALLVGALWLAAQAGGPQRLYFLSATYPVASNGTLPANLYRADAQGGPPQFVRSVAKGADTVLADYDRRKLVVASPGEVPDTFSVVDMSAPANVHSVSIRYNSKQLAPYTIYLLDRRQEGLWVAMRLGDSSTMPPTPLTGLTAASLESNGADGRTLPVIALEDVRFSGVAGGALTSQHTLAWVRGDPLHIPLVGDPAGSDLQIPQATYLKAGADASATYELLAANDSVVLLTLSIPGPVAGDTIHVYDRSSRSWRPVTLPFPVSAIRAFGPWVAAISTMPRGGPDYGKGRTEFNSAEFAAMRASPGQDKRLAEKLDRRSTIDDRFNESSAYYPGDLIVLNTRSNQRYTIHTGEGDSEVLLANNESVYYRVNDAIFRTDISRASLGAPIKIAEGAEVPQAHWAFLGPAEN